MHRLDLADGQRVVLRRYVWPGMLEDEPDAPEREAEALRFGRRHGLSMPELLAADLTGTEVGDGVPTLAMSFLPGRAVAAPDPMALAEAAASIHRVDGAGFDHEYFPWYGEAMGVPPPATTRPGLWERAIEVWRTRTPAFQPVWIHRDFHPGNVLWVRHHFSGVVDWVTACRGPLGCDVATCRANLIDWAGPQAADAFVDAYAAVTGYRLEPYWILANLMEAGPRHWTTSNLATAEPVLARVLAQVD